MSGRNGAWRLIAAMGLTLASCGLPGARPDTTGPQAVERALARAGTAAVELVYTDRQQVQKLVDAGLDVWGKDRTRKTIWTTLDREQYMLAKNLGMRVTLRTDVPRVRTFDPDYHTFEELQTALKQLAARYSDRVELVAVGKSWETSQGKANRPLWALHLRRAPEGSPTVLYAGCHHARELVTPEMVLNMARLLLEQDGQDPEITAWIKTRDIWLVPMVNPDGHILAEQGDNHRKNTNRVTGGVRNVGVDLNRNYDASWGTAGDSGNRESDVFRGASAFSEPETQAMRDLMMRIKPVFLLTYHSFSNAVMWSWDKTSAPPPDRRLALVGAQLGKLSGYDAYQGSQMYVNSGDDVDWAFEKLGTLAYTIEVGSFRDGFDPPFERVAKFWQENRPMMLHVLRLADNPGAAAGPEVSMAGLQDGILSVSTVTKTPSLGEAFLDRPGASGTGMPLSGSAGRLSARMPGIESVERRLVWVHVKGQDGTWGPWKVIWNRPDGK